MIIHCPKQIFTSDRLPLEPDRWRACVVLSPPTIQLPRVESVGWRALRMEKWFNTVTTSLSEDIYDEQATNWQDTSFRAQAPLIDSAFSQQRLIKVEIRLQTVSRVKLSFDSIKFTPSSIRFMNKNSPRDEKQHGQIRRLIYEAMAIWQHNSNLKLTEVRDDDADILIDFARGNHGDNFEFLGPGGSLGKTMRRTFQLF